MAMILPVRLCKAISGGLRDQLRQDGVVANGSDLFYEVDIKYDDKTTTDDEDANVDGHPLRFDDGEASFFDDFGEAGDVDDEGQISKYKALLQGINEKEKEEKENKMGVEITWEPGEKEMSQGARRSELGARN